MAHGPLSPWPSAALTVALVSVLVGCPAPPREPVGTSDKPRAIVKPKEAPKPSNAPPADLRAGVTPIPGKWASLGHTAGRWEYTLSANDAGRAALEGKVAEAAVGAKIVMEHTERGSGEKGPTMVLEKRAKGFDPEHGDFRYVIVGKSGALVFDGTTERCWGCHDDAPHGFDHVFPPQEPR